MCAAGLWDVEKLKHILALRCPIYRSDPKGKTKPRGGDQTQGRSQERGLHQLQAPPQQLSPCDHSPHPQGRLTCTQDSHQVSRGPDSAGGRLVTRSGLERRLRKLTGSEQRLQQALGSGLRSPWQTGCIPMLAETQLSYRPSCKMGIDKSIRS